MMKYFLLLFVSVYVAGFAQDNQQEPLIIGSITDEQKNPVPFGNIEG
jgi:hypothetical protein